MKIAAIDVGTNSFHLLIGQVSADGQVVPIERAKDMVRLGDSAFGTGVISAEAFARASEALRNFKRLAERHHCDGIVAAATSATREADNGGDFVRAMRDETGIDLQVISGEEEARLIYLGARSVLPLASRRALLVDIGGGSVEVMVGDSRELYFQRSLKLGVLRLLSQLKGDPPSHDDRAHLAEFCHRALERVAAPMQRIGFDFVAISAGTARAIYELCNPSVPLSRPPDGDRIERPERSDRGRIVRFADVYALEQRLCSLSNVERARIPGLDARRVDSIVPGVILVRSLLEVFHADQYQLCEAALREGLIHDYAAKNRPGIQLVDEFPDLRRRSVVTLMRRTQAREPHAYHVARLSLDLFRGLRPLHGLPNADGELLEFAALLHDIGFYIAPSKHHKHGQYLIENVGLAGFTPDEISLLSQTVRYHRKSTPKDTHEAFAKLSDSLRRRIRIHAALLRVADGLDRTNRQLVRSVRCRILSRDIELVLTLAPAITGDDPDIELELWSARRKADLLEEVFRRKVRLLVALPSAQVPIEEDATK
ncbi:MAG: Ppx/GppA family phosphatase [Myxococcales bacterium]|nr:Ppx/GppA family phosphatase [Myxococcales bacterium]